MKILVLNCGSSSIKYQFIDTESKTELAKGSVERIGMSGAVLSHTRYDGDKIKIAGEILDHTIAIEYVLGVLLSKNHGVIYFNFFVAVCGNKNGIFIYLFNVRTHIKFNFTFRDKRL